MSLKSIVLIGSLTFATAAFAQSTSNGEPQIKPTGPGLGSSQETSDRTPGKTTQTPQNQTDTYDSKTSDRSGNKNVTVDHQPAAAGTASTETSKSKGDQEKAMP